jgi:hypothetical protein
MSVRIHDVTARMSIVDGDSLLTPQLMARIVAAVTQALEASRADEKSRQRDTKVGGCCSACDDGERGHA